MCLQMTKENGMQSLLRNNKIRMIAEEWTYGLGTAMQGIAAAGG